MERWAKRWNYVFRIADIWKNNDLSFEERRDAIMRRMHRQPWFEDFEQELGIASNLETSDNPDEWDEWWEQFYDWCDIDKRVWVKIV